jgi:hypothetical protein
MPVDPEDCCCEFPWEFTYASNVVATVFISYQVSALVFNIDGLTSSLATVWSNGASGLGVAIGVGPTVFYPDGNIAQVATSDGSAIWDTGTPLSFGNTDATHLYVPNGSGHLQKWLPGTGLVWSFTSFGGTKPVVDLSGNVFIHSTGGTGLLADAGMYKIDSSGNHVTTGGWPFIHGEAVNTLRFATDDDGNVYAGTTAKLYKISPSATQVWMLSVATSVCDVAVDADHNVYLAAFSGGILKYDNADPPNLLWTYDPGGDARCVAVDTGGNVYGGWNNGHVAKLDSDGNLLTSTTVLTVVDKIECLPGRHPHFQ